jgi:hypothetical protein
MKQCKVCGTLVHIDSNTCPSCGNHNFFVLDVKICPLCGKVNSITSSFCEQCGKQFVTAQGAMAFPNKVPQVQRNIYPNRPMVKRSEEYGKNQEERDYEIEKPVIKSPKPLIFEENAAERAYKDFIALKPEIANKEDCSEYSYYVKGDANKLPVIILPKFAKTQGKNILVNIIVNNEPEKPDTGPQPASKTAEDKSTIITQDNLEKVFTPYSVIENEPQKQPEEKKEKTESLISEAKPVSAEDGGQKIEKRKKLPQPRDGVSPKSILSSVVMAIMSLGLIATLLLVFYLSGNPAHRTAGISPVLYAFKDMFKTNITLPFVHDNGFEAFSSAYSGQYAQYKNIVPYLFLALFVLPLFNFFVVVFTLRQKIWAKICLIISSLLIMIDLTLIVLSIQYVYNQDIIQTMGLGLICACVVALINFILVVTAYKPIKD